MSVVATLFFVGLQHIPSRNGHPTYGINEVERIDFPTHPPMTNVRQQSLEPVISFFMHQSKGRTGTGFYSRERSAGEDSDSDQSCEPLRPVILQGTIIYQSRWTVWPSNSTTGQGYTLIIAYRADIADEFTAPLSGHCCWTNFYKSVAFSNTSRPGLRYKIRIKSSAGLRTLWSV